ncbi:hypothetical protein FUAX_41850 (plasmid) [Fulvitalea axinellae]|uniref:Uncharacterized protein n=1 Tax=Fulvitalea axinellae TaxID=1182444 RepID=A0AAU9D6W7_9BACT|nr:hypothetical protein FUAX_41850 [Fulvitalea axinellae]
MGSSYQNVEIYDIKGEEIEKVSERLINIPKVTIVDKNNLKQIRPHKGEKRGVHHLEVSDQYVFCSFRDSREEQTRDELVNNYILKYDWNGKPLVKYKLDKRFNYFTYDPVEDVFYAISRNSDFMPTLIRFSLP